MVEHMLNSSKIPELFTAKCILVTGATGFLGKVLIEKLLRSCPGIKEVFVLMRPSKKQSVLERLLDLRANPVFDRLRLESPSSLLKIWAIEGDISFENLALSEHHLQKVISEVSFIFHCAANVRFEDEPRNTITANLLGVKNMLEVAKTCKILEAFVHVSTAYAFCNQSDVAERVYPETVSADNIMSLLGWMTDDELREFFLHIRHKRPSLYQFSKALAEKCVAKYAHEYFLPVIIVRPSIVTAAVEEPFPGWIDNYNGPSGFIALSESGLVKTLLVDPKVNADWVPVDIVANTLIVAAYYIAVRSKRVDLSMKLTAFSGVPIVHCTCPKSKLMTWMEIIKICVVLLEKYPSNQTYGKPGGTVTSNVYVYAMRRMTSHYLPAVIMDIFSTISGRKARTIDFYRKIHRVMGHLQLYTTQSFTFYSPNMRRLVMQMEPGDNLVFPIDQRTLDWMQYLENYVLGVRRYFLKEKDETILNARKRMMRAHYLWLALKMSSLIAFFLMIRSMNQRGLTFRSIPGSFLVPSLPISLVRLLKRIFHFHPY